MNQRRKTVFFVVAAFIFISLFSSTSFAGGKKWGKHKGNIGYPQGHHYDCNLPPGLDKQGKVPPGWEKKCGPLHAKRHGKKNGEYYSDDNHNRASGSYNKPIIEGGLDIGVGIHLPLGR
jgi:hypothetical protein